MSGENLTDIAGDSRNRRNVVKVIHSGRSNHAKTTVDGIIRTIGRRDNRGAMNMFKVRFLPNANSNCARIRQWILSSTIEKFKNDKYLIQRIEKFLQ